MRDIELKARLLDTKSVRESTEEVMTDVDNVPEESTSETKSSLQTAAENVMISYQNANKWLDIIKEAILMDIGCVFFSNYVHNLAHTMPVRFDSFGDILHTIDMKVPYPATEYIKAEPKDINDSITQVCGIIKEIELALSAFIESADKEGYRSAARSAETLLSDISTEYTAFYDMRRAFTASGGDLLRFDKWVAQYVSNKSTLLG